MGVCLHLFTRCSIWLAEETFYANVLNATEPLLTLNIHKPRSEGDNFFVRLRMQKAFIKNLSGRHVP